MVFVEACDAENARSVYYGPFSLVVAEQSLEVGHIHTAVVVAEDVEVAVVGSIVGSGEVDKERVSHRRHYFGGNERQEQYNNVITPFHKPISVF